MIRRISIITAIVAGFCSVCEADEQLVSFTGFDGWTADVPLVDRPDNDTGKNTANYEKCFFTYEPRRDNAMDASVALSYGESFDWKGPSIVSTNSYEVGRPDHFRTSVNKNHLSFSTGWGVLYRTLFHLDEEFNIGEVKSIDEDTGLYIDQLIQFTPVSSRTAPGGADPDDKLCIWLQEMTNTSGQVTGTNLCCMAQGWDWDDVPVYSNVVFTLVPANGVNFPVRADTWYRLTVKAFRNVFYADELGIISAFRIYVNGLEFKPSVRCFSTSFAQFCRDGELVEDDMAELLDRGVLVGSLEEMRDEFGDTSLSAVGLEGEGRFDDFYVSESAPIFDGGVLDYIDFTLAWDSHVSAFTYTIMRGSLKVELPEKVTGLTAAGSRTFTDKLFVGNRVEVTDVVYADGFSEGTWTKEGNVLVQNNNSFVANGAGGRGTVVSAPHSISGTGTEANPFLIGSYADLAYFRANPTDKYYRQTADISLDPDIPWMPISSFSGTYNGGGHFVSGVRVTEPDANPEKWVGFFNTLDGATLCDFRLTDANVSGGNILNAAILCGTAAGNTTISGVTVSGGIGVEGCAAGFVGDVTGDLLISSCTNNAPVSGGELAGGFVCQLDKRDAAAVVLGSRSRRAVSAHAVTSRAFAGAFAAYVGEQSSFAVTNSIGEGSVSAKLDVATSTEGRYAAAGGVVGNNEADAEGLSVSSVVVTGSVTVTCTEVSSLAAHGGVGGVLGYGGAAIEDFRLAECARVSLLMPSNESRYAACAFVGWNDNSTVSASGSMLAHDALWPSHTSEGTEGMDASVSNGVVNSWGPIDDAFRACAPSGVVLIAKRPVVGVGADEERMVLTQVMTDGNGRLTAPTVIDVYPVQDEISAWVADGYEVVQSGNVWVVRQSPPPMVDFYLYLDSTVSAVRYVIGDSAETNDYEVTGPFEVAPDVPVTLIPSYADWCTGGGVSNLSAAAASGFVVTPNGTGAAKATVYGEFFDPAALAGISPADLGIVDGPFASLTAGTSELSNLVAWAEGNAVSVADVNSLAEATPAATNLLTAYLLNAEPARVDVEDPDFSFRVSAFDGATAVVVATDKDGVEFDLGDVNGHWAVRTSTDLKNWSNVGADTAADSADVNARDVPVSYSDTVRFFVPYLSLLPVIGE